MRPESSTDGDEGDGQRAGSPQPAQRGRRVVYCLLPFELAAEIHESLRRHFGDDPGVEVVVERRRRERRSRSERRAPGEAEPPGSGERRRIQSQDGRRVGEQRADLAELASRLALPRRARRHAEQIAFVERCEPAAEPAEDLDSARLVIAFQGGDEDAFATLYTRYFDRVYSYLRVVVRRHHLAEDLTQQVFLKALEALPRYEHRGSPLRVWLFAIARNLASTQLRRLARVELAEPLEIERTIDAEAPAPPLASALDWITDRDLLVFLERLPETQRQALTLRYLLDLSNLQIAEVMGRSPNDVAVLQKRALAFIRERLDAVGSGHRPSRRPGRARMRAWNPQARVLRERRFALFR